LASLGRELEREPVRPGQQMELDVSGAAAETWLEAMDGGGGVEFVFGSRDVEDRAVDRTVVVLPGGGDAATEAHDAAQGARMGGREAIIQADRLRVTEKDEVVWTCLEAAGEDVDHGLDGLMVDVDVKRGSLGGAPLISGHGLTRLTDKECVGGLDAGDQRCGAEEAACEMEHFKSIHPVSVERDDAHRRRFSVWRIEEEADRPADFELPGLRLIGHDWICTMPAGVEPAHPQETPAERLARMLERVA